jgi:hypothetical protein
VSDQQPYIDARDLYQLMLQSFPTTGKTPQAQEKDRAAYADQIYQMLGFNPLTYEAPTDPTPIAYTPKPSSVRLQYGNDPVVNATLDDIDAGHESSASVATKLIDPDTGGLSEAAVKNGISMAQAQTAVDAAKAYEKERADNTVDQQLYEARQMNDPTFGVTKGTPGSTSGKHVLPPGQLGQETPQFGYSQGLLDQIQNLSAAPERQDVYWQDPGVLDQPQAFPAGAPAGSQSAIEALQQKLKAPAPFLSPAFGSKNEADQASARKGTAPQTSVYVPSKQERAAGAANRWQQFAQKYGSDPVESQANKAAVQRLLQIQAALGG